MKKYRCYVCEGDKGTPGRDFEADVPVCPVCGIDSRKDPRDAGMIVELATIHFDPPRHAKAGHNHAACNPTLKAGAGGAPEHGIAGVRVTGAPHAVTCDACRKSAEWLKAAGETPPPTLPPEKDVPLTIDPVKGILIAEAGG